MLLGVPVLLVSIVSAPEAADQGTGSARRGASGRRYLLERAERAKAQQLQQDADDEARREDQDRARRRWDAWWEQSAAEPVVVPVPADPAEN